MDYRFTRHAKNRMRLWRLTTDDVIDAVVYADQTAPTPTGEWMATRFLSSGRLEVVYVIEQAEIVIITVTLAGARRRAPA